MVAVALALELAKGSKRLHITNGCGSEPLWIAHEGAGGTGPDQQNVRIDPWMSYDFSTYGNLKATRYWPKMGCDAMGNDCSLGGSGGPGEACVKPGGDYLSCAPPVDTKFEATFGQDGAPCNPSTNNMEGCDYVDISLVDGFTLPFKLELKGNCNKGGGLIDCSGLSFAQCPTREPLYRAGTVANLQAINPHTNQVVGCYSPCTKLIDDKWNNVGRAPSTPEAAPYCCPTPPESPQQCRAGPIKDTIFVQTVHRNCPGVYSYSYDDGMGLIRCDSTTQYEVTFFCPPEPVRRKNQPQQVQQASTGLTPLKAILYRWLTLGGLLRRYELAGDDLPPHPEMATKTAVVGGTIVLAAALAGATTLIALRTARAWQQPWPQPWHDAVPLSPGQEDNEEEGNAF